MVEGLGRKGLTNRGYSMKLWSKEDRECIEKYNYFEKVFSILDRHPLILAACNASLDALPQLLVHTDSAVRRAARGRLKRLTDGTVE